MSVFIEWHLGPEGSAPRRVVYDPSGGDDIAIDPGVTSPGISNIAATCFQLLGMEPPAWVDPPLLVFGED